MARGKYKEKSKNPQTTNNQKAITEDNDLTVIRYQEEDIEKNKVNENHFFDNGLIYEQVGFITKFLIMSYIFAVLQGGILYKYNSISEIMPNYFVTLIILYYVAIIFQNKTLNLDNIKSSFFNFVGIITLYNIFLLYNPFNMIEISSDYFLSNILYFYLSFLIITFDYKFYDKIVFIINIFFGLIEKTKKEIMMPLLTTFLIILMTSIIIANIYIMFDFDEFMFLIILYIGARIYVLIAMTLFMIFLFSKFTINVKNNSNNQKQYVKLRSIVEKFEKLIETFIKWFLELFKIEKINSFSLMTKDGTINKLNTLTTILTKIAPFILLTILVSSKAYYPVNYSIENEKYCINKGISNDSKIIKLKNGNILLSENNQWNEVACEREKNELKMNTFKISNVINGARTILKNIDN